MLDDILKRHSHFDEQEKTLDFIALFKELYKIKILKPSLDAILSLTESGFITFVFLSKFKKETLQGCCITQKKTVFNKLFGSFTSHHHHKIQIKKLTSDILMHEMAHALEYQSGLKLLQSDFPQAFKYDLQMIDSAPFLVKEAIKQILYKDIKLYPVEQHSSEFLARYYEILAMSKGIGIDKGRDYVFTIEEVLRAFPNVTKWIEKTFNEAIKTKIREHISNMTQKISFDKNLNSFVRRTKNVSKATKKSFASKAGSLFSSTSELKKIEKNNKEQD